jgi:hypothetical protein
MFFHTLLPVSTLHNTTQRHFALMYYRKYSNRSTLSAISICPTYELRISITLLSLRSRTVRKTFLLHLTSLFKRFQEQNDMSHKFLKSGFHELR